MRHREHVGEATTGVSGAFPDEAIRPAILRVALQADTGAILAHGDVAAVVRGVLDRPMVSDGGGGANGGDRGGGEVESGLGGAMPETGAGAAGEDIALDADHGAGQG